jgi:flagellar biosynthesis chaperone FliJ
MEGIKKATDNAQKISDIATREKEKTAHEIKRIQDDIYRLNQNLEKIRDEKKR